MLTPNHTPQPNRNVISTKQRATPLKRRKGEKDKRGGGQAPRGAGEAPGIWYPKAQGSAKECSSFWTIAFIPHAAKVMLKILQVRLQQYITENFQMYNPGLERAEEPEIKLPTSAGS